MKVRRLSRPVLLLLAVLLAWGSASGGELDKSRRTLEAIQKRIRETSANLEQKQAAASSLAGDLRTVEGEMGRIKGRLAALRRRSASLEKEIARKEGEVARSREGIARLEGKVRLRLAALYKSGEMGLLRVVFGSDSPSRRAEEYDFLGRVVRRDRELLVDYRRQLAGLEEALAQLDALRREQQQALADLRGDQETLRKAAALKEQLLARVRSDEAALADQLAELRLRAARLSDLVKKLETEKTREYTEKTGLFAGAKGRLPWPGDGPVKVGFGPGRHPELGTQYDSQGVEIAVPPGTPVAAVWPGRVVFANRFQGYGNLLILDHGDGYYTLYAQADRLGKQVGATVSAGEVIAYSGFDGGETLYFEIRHHGTPLDPAGWLAPR